jgi:FSR family fosmidomycin resistance protein-like MFS transporter
MTTAQGSWLGLRGRVWLMTLGHLVIDSNGAVLFALLPLFVTNLRINFAQAGALATLLLVTSSVTQPVFGALHDRSPNFPMASVGLILAGIAMGLTGFAVTYAQMIALVLLCGLGVAAFHPQAVAQTSRASADHQAWGIAVFFTGASVGTAMMSLLIVPLAAEFGSHATLIVLVPALIAAFLFGRAYSSWIQPPVRAAGGAGAAASIRAVAVPLSMLVTISVLRSAVVTAYLTFLPTLVMFKTGSLGFGAAVLASFLFAGSIGTLIGGAAAQALGGAPVVFASLVAGLLCLLPVPWLPGELLLPWMVMVGLVMFGADPQITALGQRLLPAFVGVASSLIMGVGLGFGNGGAFITGLLADRLGIQVALTAITLLMVGAIVAASVYIIAMRRRQPAAGAPVLGV